MLKVDVVTNIPTPYNAALFGAFSRIADLRVHFEAPTNSLRSWTGVSEFLGEYESVTHRSVQVGRWGFWAPGLAGSVRRDIDVLLLGGSYASPTIASLLLHRPTGAACVFWGEQFMSTRVVNSRLRRTLLGRADSLLAIGEHAAQQYRRLTDAPVNVLPYAVAVPRQSDEGAKGRIGFVGQIIPRKGLDLLFEACSEAGGRALDIVGSGPLEEDLRRYAADRGLKATWHGECPNSAIDRIRGSWSYQVVPSRYDGWGVVVNEALAAGTPVVVSSAAGAAELVREGVNGWIHAGNDVVDLTAALKRADQESLQADVRRSAAVTGDSFSAGPAARFLADVLSEPGANRSFIEEQWRAAEGRLQRGFDPKDSVPDPICGDDSPPT